MEGSILEIGAGGGSNLPFYPADPQRGTRLVLLEPDASMRKYAVSAIQKTQRPVELIAAPAEKIPFEAQRFDNVVSTLVLCSVQQPKKALTEIYRVLKPSGRFYFMEHVLSEKPAFAKLQHWLTPLQRHLAAGCHLNRNTIEDIQDTGFHIILLKQPKPSLPFYIGIAEK